MELELRKGVLQLRQVFTTAVAFVSFFFLCLLFVLFVPMFVWGTCKTQVERQRKARQITQKSFEIYIRFLTLLRFIKLTVDHPDRLGLPSQIVVLNHPTLLDTVILMSLIPNANCIIKADLKRNWVTSIPVRVMGYIANDGGQEIVEDASRGLMSGDTLLIFPEGTRTKPNKTSKLAHGAAQIALKSNACLTPVRIECFPMALQKGIPWYRTAGDTMYYRLIVKDDIDVAPYRHMVDCVGRPQAVRALTLKIKEKLLL